MTKEEKRKGKRKERRKGNDEKDRLREKYRHGNTGPGEEGLGHGRGHGSWRSAAPLGPVEGGWSPKGTGETDARTNVRTDGRRFPRVL